MLSLKSFKKYEKLNTIKHLGSFIINNNLSSSFPDVLSACITFDNYNYIITVAEAERFFSKVNYLRNS